MKIKYRLQGLVIGIFLTLIFTLGITSFGAGLVKTIDVGWNSMIINLNGVQMSSDNLIYDGRTYVWIRDVANMFDKDVVWRDGNVVDINDKVIEETPLGETPLDVIAPESTVESETSDSIKNVIVGTPPGTGSTESTETIITPLPGNSDDSDLLK